VAKSTLFNSADRIENILVLPSASSRLPQGRCVCSIITRIPLFFREQTRGAKSIAMAAMHQSLPLAGIQVVDFGQYIAGPLTARLLADAGATVTKIDPPDGAPLLACAFACTLPQLRLRRHARRALSFAATSTRSSLEEQRKPLAQPRQEKPAHRPKVRRRPRTSVATRVQG